MSATTAPQDEIIDALAFVVAERALFTHPSAAVGLRTSSPMLRVTVPFCGLRSGELTLDAPLEFGHDLVTRRAHAHVNDDDWLAVEALREFSALVAQKLVSGLFGERQAVSLGPASAVRPVLDHGEPAHLASAVEVRVLMSTIRVRVRLDTRT